MILTNSAIARKLQAHAAELAREGSNLYRVRAFRQAAFAVLGLEEPLALLLQRSGRAGLVSIPGIGKSLAETLEGLVTTGSIPAKSEKNDGCREADTFGLMRVCPQSSEPSSN